MFNLMAKDDKSCSAFFKIILYAIILNVPFVFHKPCARKQMHRIEMYHQGQ